ncbi:MAG: MMPL family transporter [Thermocladium sp.]|jgi:RND superfamily putative drug exporter
MRDYIIKGKWLIVWIALIASLSVLAPRVFSVLIYNDSQLLPNNLPPVIISHYLTANQSQYTAIILNSTNLNELAQLDASIREPHLDQLTLYRDDVLPQYNETISKYIHDEESNATMELIRAWSQMNSTCSELIKLNTEYYAQLSQLKQAEHAISRYVLIYNSALAKHLEAAGPNANASQVAIATINSINASTNYSRLMKLYGYGIAEALHGYTVQELAPGTLSDAFTAGYDLVMQSLKENYSLVFSRPNSTLALAIAAGPSSLYRIRLAVASLYVNSTPAIIRPLLPQIACASNISSIEASLNSSISSLIISVNPPPSPLSIKTGLVNGSYALILVNSTIQVPLPRNESIFVFSPSLINSQLISMVENDVPTIDKVTGTAVLSMLLFVLGTIMGPLIVLAMLGAADAASLGSIYLLSKSGLSVYYLTVYLTSPIILGIGVDYSLLIIGRYLEERRRGRGREEALMIVKRITVPTILSSGSVVAVGLGSYMFSTYQYIQVIGLAYIVSVALVLFTVILALIDVISIMGDRILWPMGLKSNTRELSTKLLIKLTRISVERPKTIIAIFALVTLISLLIIARFMVVTSNPVYMMPSSNPVIGLHIMQERFPNFLQSTGYILMKPSNHAAYEELITQMAGIKAIGNITLIRNSSSIMLLEFPVKYDVFSDKLIGVYGELSSIASAVSTRYGVTVLIGGDPGYKYYGVQAFEEQFYHVIAYIVVALVMIMLFITLRSALIPIRLIVTVLMSMSWAMALTVLVFQVMMGIPTYYLLPIILYSLLMSVGTDYDIFIISRVREEVIRGASDKEAIIRSIEATGPIVSGAAMVLATAFAGLAVSRLFILKEIGFAVAIAVAMDALLLRPVLVPAILMVLGKWNWWPLKINRASSIELHEQ